MSNVRIPNALIAQNISNNLSHVQGGFFDWSALKMTRSQPLKEFSELVLPKKRLRMKKVKVPELVLPQKRLRKEKVSVPPTPLVIILGYLRSH